MGIADMLIGGYNSGRALAKDRQAEANKSRLGELLGNAYATGDYKTALPEMARIDPGAAMDTQKQFQGIEESERAEFAQTAQVFTQAMTPEQRAQAWPAIRQKLAQRIPEAQYPEQWDESLLPQAQQLAALVSGGKPQEKPASIQELEYLLANPKARELDMQRRRAPPAAQFHVDRDGVGQWLIPPTVGAGPAMAGPAPTTGGGGQMMRDTFDAAVAPLLEREGGYVANDAGAGPTNYGINSRANPDVNVASLTPMDAREIYKERYWDAIGADQLPPQIREAAFDAAVNMGVNKARELLQQSGGDPAKFDELRRQHYGRLAQGNPEQYGQYAAGWDRRVAETGAGSPQAAPGGAIPIPGFRGMPKGGANRVAPLSAEEVASLGLPAGTVAQRNEQTGAVSVIHKPAAAKPSGGRKAMSGEVANKVGLYDNAIRSAREWFDLVAEKDAQGNFTGGYNNRAAMLPEAKSAFLNSLRAKLRAESGAAISEQEIEGEAQRYAARVFGGDHVDLQNASRLLRDLVQQREMLVGGNGGQPAGGGQYQVGQVIEKGGRKYRVVGGDMDDPEVEEI